MFDRIGVAAAALVFLAAPVAAGPITIIDTLGPSNTFATINPYTAQFGVNAFAVQINVAQTIVIDEVKIAGHGEFQLRWATNSASGLPTTPFFGGIGLFVDGVTDLTGTFGSLLPGTYWVEYLTDFGDPQVNRIYRTAQNLTGHIAINSTIDQFGLIDQTAWNGQTGDLPGITLSGHNVPEPASLAVFGTALAALGLLRRRRAGAVSRRSAFRNTAS